MPSDLTISISVFTFFFQIMTIFRNLKKTTFLSETVCLFKKWSSLWRMVIHGLGFTIIELILFLNLVICDASFCCASKVINCNVLRYINFLLDCFLYRPLQVLYCAIGLLILFCIWHCVCKSKSANLTPNWSLRLFWNGYYHFEMYFDCRNIEIVLGIILKEK